MHSGARRVWRCVKQLGIRQVEMVQEKGGQPEGIKFIKTKPPKQKTNR